jgi:hypothetical protein
MNLGSRAQHNRIACVLAIANYGVRSAQRQQTYQHNACWLLTVPNCATVQQQHAVVNKDANVVK